MAQNSVVPPPETVAKPTSWSDSRFGRMISTRMLKFAAVGGIGILVNLLVLAFLQQSFSTRAVWTSLTANAVATLHNYIVNNLWTFRDRQRSGEGWLRGVALYFAVAAIGIAVTTGCYSLFNHLAAKFLPEMVQRFATLSAQVSQLAAIVVGTSLNYFLNHTITWRLDTQPLE